MDGMVADPDGIRAAAALARHQADQIKAIDEYMRRTCQAAGAFTGPTMLSLFEGTYESAFGIAANGLAASFTTNIHLADALEAAAGAYEAADRGSYDVFARVAGGQSWEINPYAKVGSGQATFTSGPPIARASIGPAGPAGAVPGDGSVVGGALDKRDGVVGFVDTHVESHAKALLGKMSHETVMYGSHLIYKDDLPEGAEADLPTNPGALDRMDTRLEGLNPLTDPMGIDKFKENLADRAVGKIDLPGHMGAERTLVDAYDNEHNGVRSMTGRQDDPGYHDAAAREKAIGDRVGRVTDTYDAGKAVLDFRHDHAVGIGGIAAGLHGTWDDLNAAAATRDRLHDLAGAGPDTSATDWARRP